MAAEAHASTRSASVRRPRRLTLSAAWLVVSGALGAFYAGIVPPLAPLVSTPEPAVGIAAGVAAVAAAIGVWRVASWGRWLGVACLLLGIVQSAAYELWRATAGPELGAPSPAPFADLLVSLLTWALSVAVLWVLVRRWPSTGA